MHAIARDHFEHPRNVGDLADPDVSVTVENPVCGDVLKLDLRLREGRIAEAMFRTLGCSTAIAASSLLTVLLKGRTWPQALELRREEIAQQLGGLPASKVHCSVLGEEAVRAAARSYLHSHPDPQLQALLQ